MPSLQNGAASKRTWLFQPPKSHVHFTIQSTTVTSSRAHDQRGFCRTLPGRSRAIRGISKTKFSSPFPRPPNSATAVAGVSRQKQRQRSPRSCSCRTSPTWSGASRAVLVWSIRRSVIDRFRFPIVGCRLDGGFRPCPWRTAFRRPHDPPARTRCWQVIGVGAGTAFR